MLEKQLTTLGFNKNEIKVYLGLFELGKSKAKKIIEHTSLHRNLVYTSLEDLVGRGLVSKVEKNKIFHFEANNPESVLEIVEKQKNIAKSVVEALKVKQSSISRNIKVFEGNEGIKQARERSLGLSPDETVYVLGGSQLSSDPELEKFWRKYDKRRSGKGINLKILYDRTTPKEILDWRNNLQRTEAAYLPFNVETPTWFEMYGNTLGIGVPGEDPLLFSVNNKSAVDSMKKYFEFFWNQEVVVETGMDALEKTIYNMLGELDRGEEYLVLGASAGEHSAGVRELYDRFHKDRFKKGVITKMLVYKESFEKISQRFAKIGDPEFLISKLKKFSSAPPIPMQINIYKNKTFFIIYSDEPTILHFDRKEVHDSFKSYFNELWNQESVVLKGPEVVRDIWLESLQSGELKFIGARGYFIDRFPEMFVEIEEKAKKVENLKWKNIVDESFKDHKLTKLPWMETSFNIKGSKNPNVVWLWGDKVALANWTEKEPVVFVSSNKHVVQSYRDYFDELWELK